MRPRSRSDTEGRRRRATTRHKEQGPMTLSRWTVGAGVTLAALTVALVAGCGQRDADKPQEPASEAGKQAAREKKIEANRAKLSAADRALVDEQDHCAVQTRNKLGGMGVPIKVMV